MVRKGRDAGMTRTRINNGPCRKNVRASHQVLQGRLPALVVVDLVKEE